MTEAVVLVEGLSDCFAVEAAARGMGRRLADEGVAVVSMSGITNVDRFVARYEPSGARLAGLCDAAEARFFSRAFERPGLVERARFFVCHRDLEDELIRALGPGRVQAIIEQEGELGSLRKLQQMPYHRGRPTEDQLHRFLGSKSGRKHRYASLFVEALDGADVPQPLRDLLSYV